MTTKNFRARKQAEAAEPVPMKKKPRLGAANDAAPGGRVPASVLAKPPAANDDHDDLTPPASDLAMAVPAPGHTPQTVHDWVVVKLRAISAASANYKMRRIADAILEQIKAGMPLASYGGTVCWEPLIAAAGLHARDAAPGEPVRHAIDTLAQGLVSFPCHVAEGCRFRDPVAALYALRVWGKPVGRAKGTISLVWLKEMTGVPVSAAKQNRLFKRLKLVWVRDGTITLEGRSFSGPKVEGLSRGEEVLAVERTIRGFDVAGGALPACTHRQGVLDKAYIADLAGVSHKVMDYPEVVRMVNEVRRRRGLAVPGFDLEAGLLAQFQVEVVTRERNTALLSGVKKPEERVSAIRSALTHLISMSGLATEDPASALFGDAVWETALARAAGHFDNARTRSNFMGRANRLKCHYDDLLEQGTADGTLAERLTALIGHRGLNRQQLAEAAGCSSATVRNWTMGGRVSVSLMPALARIEEYLRVPSGQLVGLARRGWAFSSERKLNPRWSSVPHRIARLLPHEVRFLSDAEIDRAVAAVSPLVRDGSDYALVGNAGRSEAYRIPKTDFCDRYVREREAYRRYKTAVATAPLLRAPKARWREEHTVFERLRQQDGVMNLAIAPCTDDKTTGLGMPPQGATMAWFAVPGFIRRWFLQASTHLDDVALSDGKRGAVYTTRMRHMVWSILSLTHPVMGYLTQQPSFAEVLEPIPATASSERFRNENLFADEGEEGWILSPGEVELARSDWSGFVDLAHRTARQILEFIDDDVAVVRDAMKNAEGLLHGDEPAADYIAALVSAETRFRAERRGVFLATEVRNCLMCHISLCCGFRPKNVRELVFTGDDKGEIWKEGGVWRMKIDYRKFKNWKSCMLFGPDGHKQDYECEIADPLLVSLLDDWFYVQRPLLAGPACRHAFVTLSGGAMDASAWYDACRMFGAKYLVWNPVTQTGLRGVVSINPYVHRAIRATDILLNSEASDKVLEAAYALQTSVQMIKAHYGLLIPKKALSSSRDTYARAMGEARKRAA